MSSQGFTSPQPTGHPVAGFRGQNIVIPIDSSVNTHPSGMVSMHQQPLIASTHTPMQTVLQPLGPPEYRVMLNPGNPLPDGPVDDRKDGTGHGKPGSSRPTHTTWLDAAFYEAAISMHTCFQDGGVQRFLNGCVTTIAQCRNCCLLLCLSGPILNFRWGNTVHDQDLEGTRFDAGQLHKLYGRFTSRYKYHRLQMYENRIRKFDVSDALLEHMKVAEYGTSMFYHFVCGTPILPSSPKFMPDITRIADVDKVCTSSNYLFADVSRFMDGENAEMAKKCYMRGFSRVVEAENREDWEKLQFELKNHMHLGSDDVHNPDDDAIPLAISYKGKSVKIARRFHVVGDEGGDLDGGSFAVREDKKMTSDILEDYRWDQIICVAIEISRSLRRPKVRIWLDRLVMMGLEREEIQKRYNLVNWTDFGLMPYAVCRVIRLYNRDEIYFCTDFWRKLETVMGVAGLGLYVDDYILRKYDESLSYSKDIYSRLKNGISCIGGKGKYFRSVTLAVATAILTDAVSVREGAEDARTEKAASKWKTWAARTIAEGAYSAQHSTLLREDPQPFKIGLSEFKKIAFWEAAVSSCSQLINGSYLDMSIQRSKSYRKAQKWDGVVEWVGMISKACEITERESILNFLHHHCKIEAWRSTEGHVAAMLLLTYNGARAFSDGRSSVLKRTLVVRMSRTSSTTDGQVTAVAEATGIFGEKIIPFWAFFRPYPERDQEPVLLSTSQMFEGGNRLEGRLQPGLVFHYHWIRVSCCSPMFAKVSLAVTILTLEILLIVVVVLALPPFFVFLIPLTAVSFLAFVIWLFVPLFWPWVDYKDLGEAVFDNLLMHGLFGAGIKKREYRRLVPGCYREIRWT